jgi:general secretion pathway protein G
MTRSHQKSRDRRRHQAGITLIEMLVVITIIALFSAVAYQRMTEPLEQGRRTAARTQIEAFMSTLMTYNIEHGRFPNQEEGLQAIRPLMRKDIPLDPWNNPFVYRFPGEHGSEPEIMSYGADGQPGGEGPNEDIVSWR